VMPPPHVAPPPSGAHRKEGRTGSRQLHDRMNAALRAEMRSGHEVRASRPVGAPVAGGVVAEIHLRGVRCPVSGRGRTIPREAPGGGAHRRMLTAARRKYAAGRIRSSTNPPFRQHAHENRLQDLSWSFEFL
jgi:hypothetical protein